MSKGRPRAPRGSLKSEQIMNAACELIALTGLEKFSMPELARRLDVGVTSIYWHFRSKEELLRAIADKVTAEFYEGLDDDVGLSGDDRTLRQFRLYWHRLRENPLWREIFISSGFVAAVSISPEGSRRAGAVVQRQIERMMDAGLDVSEAAAAYKILSAWTRGSVVVMHMDAGALGANEHDGNAVINVLSSRARKAWSRTPDDDALFDAGLRALWAGLLAEAHARPLNSVDPDTPRAATPTQSQVVPHSVTGARPLQRRSNGPD